MQQTLQLHPSWFDWITVAAIVFGPVFALFAQRTLDRIREKKKRRADLYLTVMGLRATWLHPESVRALNSIDTVFDGSGDKPVRDAWASVIQHVKTPQSSDDAADHPWVDRLEYLRADLYQRLGAAVGYDHTIDYIRTHAYLPQSHVDVELELAQIRRQFAKAITDDGIRIVLTQPKE